MKGQHGHRPRHHEVRVTGARIHDKRITDVVLDAFVRVPIEDDVLDPELFQNAVLNPVGFHAPPGVNDAEPPLPDGEELLVGENPPGLVLVRVPEYAHEFGVVLYQLMDEGGSRKITSVNDPVGFLEGFLDDGMKLVLLTDVGVGEVKELNGWVTHEGSIAYLALRVHNRKSGAHMELFRTAIEVGNPADRAFVEIEPIVDTGATYSMLPSSLLKEQLGLSPLEDMTFTLADGSRQAYSLGEARFKHEGRERTSPVIFGPEDLYLLGAVSLQSLGLIADTTHHRLIPSPELYLVGIH